MPIQPVRGVGTGGIIKDIPAVLLPENIWSDGRNVRFDNASVSKIAGHVQYGTTIPSDVKFGIHWPRPTTRYTIFARGTDVYREDSAGNRSEISGSTAYSSGSNWHGSLFTGGYAVVMNNTVDTPQYIINGAGQPQNTQLVNLPGWNYTSGSTITAKVLRPFRNHLVAGNITANASGTLSENPGTIRISTAAAPGTIPQTWQPGEGDQLADEFELSQTEAIVDMAELRGHLFVYTGDSIHQVSIGQTATTVQDVAYGYGCLAINCIASFDGQHFVVDRNDIYTHSGSGQIKSVVDGKMRDYFFNNLHRTHFANTFVSVNRAQDEIWVCYPTLTANADGDCNEALIWNYRQNTWAIRDLPNVTHGFQAPSISNNAFELSNEKLILTGAADTKLYEMDTGTTFDGTEFIAYVEKKRFDPTQMIDGYKNLNKVYLTFNPQASQATIDVRVRGQNGTSVDHNLLTAKGTESREFKAETDTYQVNMREAGRLLNIRIGSSAAGSWELASYALDFTVEDKR